MQEFDFKVSATKLIQEMAAAYCGADVSTDGSKRAIAECARMLREKFADIGLEEVREAFAMATAYMLGEEAQAATTSYGGRFSVNMFGRVMSNYMEHRRIISAEIYAAQDAERMEGENEQIRLKNEAARKVVFEEFEAAKNLGHNFKSPLDIPASWARILPPSLPKNAELWAQAKRLVTDEFCAAVRTGAPDLEIGSIQRRREIAEKYKQTGQYPEELYERAQGRYARMLIFSHLKQNQ